MKIRDREAESARASLELMYSISRELTAALDLRTLLERVLKLSMSNVDAVNGSILVLDAQGNPVDSAIVVAGTVLDHTTPQLSITYEHGLAGWVAKERQAVLIRDTRQDERWLQRPDDADGQTGPKSVMCVPVLARDELVGVMTLVHTRIGAFQPQQLTLVQAIADQAGFAVLNARLYAESQRQTRVMTALAESAAALSGSLELENVLQHILVQIRKALRVEVVTLGLIDASKQELEFLASTHSNAVIGQRFQMGEGVVGWVAREGKGAIIHNPYHDPRFSSRFDQLTGFQTRAMACAPVRLGEQVIGVVQALNPLEGAFEESHLQILTGIGSLAGTAIWRAQMFERLQAAHRHYHELFEDNIDPILLTDWEGKILEANRQAVTTSGLDTQQPTDLTIASLGVVKEELLGPSFAHLRDGQMITYETQLHALDERKVPVQVYVREVDIEEASQLQWILHNLSAQKYMDSLRNDLIAMIYHDLRSPLANVVSSLDVLAAVLPPDDNCSTLLDIAVRSTERIQRLTSSLLDINRLEAGQPLGNRQPYNPAKLIDEAVEAVLPVARNKGMQMVKDVPPALPSIIVDGDMIRRVLINLAENAVKFGPTGSKISMHAGLKDGCVEFGVQDEGAGISQDDQARIFDKFTRLQTGEGPRGFGLGLAFCRIAVVGHGGRIWVESEPGQGACFRFSIPVEAAS